jgi:SM-20-related protein
MENDKIRRAIRSFLKEIGARSLSHSGRALSDHLIGTYDLLKEWNCDAATCIAGGLHSIYGTNVFTPEALPGNARPLVRQRFGAGAEKLAWLFCSLNRPAAIESGIGISRRNNTPVKLDDIVLRSLRLIEAANLLEQGESLRKWPNIRREMKMMQKRAS